MNVFYLFSGLLLFSCSNINGTKNEAMNISSVKNVGKREVFNKIDTSLLHNTWYYKKGNIDFELEIVSIKGDSVLAQYCAIAYGGDRVDCEPEKEMNVKGIVLSDTIFVDFYSFFGAKGGHAKLYFKEKKLVWKITTWPQNKDCFAPKEVIMDKE